MNISNDLITDSLHPYGVSASPELCTKIRAYIELLLLWNKQVSLTTVTNPVEIVRFHFGESAFAAHAFHVDHGRLADVGTGAGFPGLPLKSVRPELEVILIESNARKVVFLREAVRAMLLDRVEVIRSRAEDLDLANPPLDFITARAVGGYEEFICWAASHLSPDGRVILWLGESDLSVVSSNPAWNWSEPVLIPASRNRYLLQGSKKH